jgi:hypothetical protein
MHRLISSQFTQKLRRCHWLIATGLVAVMLGLGLYGLSSDSAIVDEVAHIPAGYSYLHYGDYRLNPEHPPLMKDLAALPLQFIHLNFPKQSAAWTTEVNGQWDAGWEFLYESGNNAASILFWARLPILLMGVGFGLVLYPYVKRRYGITAGLLALFFYVFSPNILANARLVTTDLGAAIMMFIALMGFIRYVERPTRKHLIWLSLGIALACVTKHSSVILYPFLLMMTIIYAWVRRQAGASKASWRTYVGGLVLASILSQLWVYLFYIPHVWNMPTSVQIALINHSLPLYPGITSILVFIAKLPGGKPLAQYLLGVIMVFGRVEGGNVTYFVGHVRNGSFRLYFPLLFVVKTQVAFLLLGLTTAGVAGWHFLGRRAAEWRQHLVGYVREHVVETTLALFALTYFAAAVEGNLNLGIRHILPIYIPLFVLVSVATVKLVRHLGATSRSWLPAIMVTLVVLLGWYAESTLAVAPHYIAYFNELIGGPGNANEYFSDSSVDWGQDLVRLHDYVEANPQINQIAIDYFGGALPEYYFCKPNPNFQTDSNTQDSPFDCDGSKMVEWHSQYGPYPGQYIAVSETYLENDRYYSALSGQSGYAYLRAMKPIAKIGYSIYVYKLY